MVKINLPYGFRGRETKERYYPPGVHDFEDALATYLVENGFGTFVENESETAASPAPEIGELRKRYLEVTGKRAFNGWDTETLIQKLAELEHD
jgi:hypothetical protein